MIQFMEVWKYGNFVNEHVILNNRCVNARSYTQINDMEFDVLTKFLSCFALAKKKMCFGIPIYFPSLLVESFFTWTIDVSQYFFIFLPNVLTPIKVLFIHPPFDLRQLPIVNCFLSLIWWPFGPFCLLVSFTICDNPLLRNWFHGKELYKIILKVFAKRIVLLTLLIANKYLTWKKNANSVFWPVHET